MTAHCRELPSFAELISTYCAPNPKERGKYVCPVCNGTSLSVGRSGKWNCFGDDSSDHRQDICKWLNQQLWEEEKKGQSSKRVVTPADRRWQQQQYQLLLQKRRLDDRIDELKYLLWNSIDPDFGLTEETYWREFIRFIVSEQMDAIKTIALAEKQVLKQCPEALKTC